MNENLPKPTAHEREPTPYPALEIDYDYYEQYLDDSELSHKEKRELIAAIASIMMAFVDLGFGIKASQHPLDEGDILPENSPLIAADLIYSEYSKEQKDDKDAVALVIAGSEES